MNHRRKLLVALGASALAAPLRTFAQQKGKVWRIGFLYYGSRQSALDSGRYQAFLQGMRELGYIEDKNFVIEARFADGMSERLPGLAAELIGLKVDVIVATGTPVNRVLHKATKTIPVVSAVSARAKSANPSEAAARNTSSVGAGAAWPGWPRSR